MADDPLTLAQADEPTCTAIVGPVWKLGGESWICQRAEGHDGDHATSDGCWWVPTVGQPPKNRKDSHGLV